MSVINLQDEWNKMSDVIEDNLVIEPSLGEINYTDVVQTDGQQVNFKAYRYKIIMSELNHIFITVLATNSAIALNGLKQQFPNKSYAYDGVSTMIIQCNGHVIV